MGANTIQYDRGVIEDQVDGMSGRMAGGGVFVRFLSFLAGTTMPIMKNIMNEGLSRDVYSRL